MKIEAQNPETGAVVLCLKSLKELIAKLLRLVEAMGNIDLDIAQPTQPI
jgi:hypothetical protein